jgi:hypothetical protein
MKKILAGVCLLGLFAVVGCGSDDDKGGGAGTPAEACKSLVATVCAKFFGCFTKEEQMAAAAIIGNNEADCRTKFEQDQCGAEMIKCDSGETYSSSKAQECIDQYKALSCDELKSGTEPAACNSVCM